MCAAMRTALTASHSGIDSSKRALARRLSAAPSASALRSVSVFTRSSQQALLPLQSVSAQHTSLQGSAAIHTLATLETNFSPCPRGREIRAQGFHHLVEQFLHSLNEWSSWCPKYPGCSAPLAHLVEHRTCNAEVTGSSPVGGSRLLITGPNISFCCGTGGPNARLIPVG